MSGITFFVRIIIALALVLVVMSLVEQEGLRLIAGFLVAFVVINWERLVRLLRELSE